LGGHEAIENVVTKSPRVLSALAGKQVQLFRCARCAVTVQRLHQNPAGCPRHPSVNQQRADVMHERGSPEIAIPTSQQVAGSHRQWGPATASTHRHTRAHTHTHQPGRGMAEGAVVGISN